MHYISIGEQIEYNSILEKFEKEKLNLEFIEEQKKIVDIKLKVFINI